MRASFSFSSVDAGKDEAAAGSRAAQLMRYEAIFDLIPEAVRVVDRRGVVTHANLPARQELGDPHPETLEELWRRRCPRQLDGRELTLDEHPLSRALRGETVRGVVVLVERRTLGTHALVEVDAVPIRDDAGEIDGAITIERDVTERSRLAGELEAQAQVGNALFDHVASESERLERLVRERTKEILQHQEARARERRLAAIGQLAAGVMHDVNNALNPIMAAAHLLSLRAEDPAAVREYATRIARAAETGAATAARVLRFIRQDPAGNVHEEIVDLATMADEVLAMMRPFWAERAQGGHVQAERRLAAGAVIRGLAGEVREALLNLVSNALDAMPEGGTLAVRTGIRTGATESEAYVEVRDTGSGMTDEVRERAFDPFFTTKSSGTGLGLSEVYAVMKRHRGRAEIESSPGQGTTVRLVFPLAAPTPRTSSDLARGRVPKRVLLVEDDQDGREFMQALLAWDGHTVETAATVSQALSRLVVEGDAPFDVLITDIGLPDGSGWEVASAARARWPQMRIGAVTGWEPRFMVNTAVDFTLRKPVRTHILLTYVAGDVPTSGTATSPPHADHS